ncbi:hypothetical protein Ahy_B04g071219 [Arachis hypogaea]|uniref:FAR1 domain-containing protein n=1 Tax=Arachis hypogaea TaxID=3818 RepID=A0A444ZKA2_ARAHY|nr:hypothetical protein Ahy_B04g071219 [Arachis hypogaea]
MLLLCRYHFESGRQTLIEIIIFVCLVPVVVHACVKLWRSEVEESENYSKESVRAPDPIKGLHVDGEGSAVGEEGSEGFEGYEGFEAESEIHDEFGDGFYDNWEERVMDEIADLGCMNLKEITMEETKNLHFLDREIAFLFYNLYAKMNGFAARRYRSQHNLNNELTQQSFVCFRQGFRKERMCDGVEVAYQKRKPKPENRCGCEAKMCVHVDKDSGRWIITYFQEVHNHKMLEDTLTFMLPGHKRMNLAANDQMNMMLKVSIKTP